MTIVPFDWTVENHGEGAIPIYMFQKANAGMMLSPWIAPCAPEEMEATLDSIAKNTLDHLKNDERTQSISSDYTKGDFKGDSFSGNYFVLTMGAGVMQAMFLMSDGHETWGGQFFGLPDQWTEALEILQSIRKE